MSNKRKLLNLTADQKNELCVYASNNRNRTQQGITNYFTAKFGHPVNRRTVSDILVQKEKWQSINYGNNKKKLRAGMHEKLEEALQLWFNTVRSQNAVVTDAILRDKAKTFGKQLNITDFQYSNGWLQRFKQQCGIAVQTINGESASVDPAVISQGRERARQ